VPTGAGPVSVPATLPPTSHANGAARGRSGAVLATADPGPSKQNGIGAAKLARDNARNELLGCVRSVSAQALPGYGVGVTGSVGGSVTPMVVSVGVGVAVVGVGVGDEVVGAGVGLLLVGGGAGLLVVGAGVADVVAVVGAAVEALGLGEGFAEPRVAAGDVAGVVAPATSGVPQVTLYAAGLDAATAGLVTTSTTSPDAGTHAGNVSGFAACVPAELKFSWTGVVFSPLDIAQ